LEYCKQLRSHKDIYKFLGLTGAHAREYYIDPLIEQGKLKILTPRGTNAFNRFYLNASAEMPSNIGDAIAYYCRTPRHLRDVARHFGLTVEQFAEIAVPLIANGKLLGNIDNLTANEKRGKSYKARFFIGEQAMRKKGDAILEFCNEPRSRDEIEAFLGNSSKYYIRYLQPLVDGGRLALTKPDQSKSADQRFVTAERLSEIEVKIISEATVREYCRTPRTRVEVARHFEVNTYIITRGFLDKMIKSGKLKITNELYPRAQTNKYFHPETTATVLSEKCLQEFCETQRTMTEITEHFGISSNENTSHYLQPLIRAGKLFGTRPQGSHDRRFTSIAPTE
jgi:ATP-dependent DNA helicase RecG